MENQDLVIGIIAKYLKKRTGTGPLNSEYAIHSYDLFSAPSESGILLKALSQSTKSFLDNVDCLVPIPKSGITIASFLHFLYGTPLLFLGENSAETLQSFAHKKVCLVDTCIASSRSFAWTLGDLEKYNLILDRLIVLLDNDLYSSPDSQLLGLRNTGKVVSLCKVSEVLRFSQNKNIL